MDGHALVAPSPTSEAISSGPKVSESEQMQAPADPPEAGAEAEAVLGQNAAKSSSSEATEAKAVSTKVQVPNDSDMISEPQTRYRDPYSNMQSASSHPLRLYTANLIVALPPSPYQHPEQPTQLQITLKLQEPYPGQQTVSSSAGPVIEIPLREHDITFVTPSQPNSHSGIHGTHSSFSNGTPFTTTATSLPPSPAPALSNTSNPAAPTTAAPTTPALGGRIVLGRPEPTPSTIAAATASMRAPLHEIPTERLVAPSSRPAEIEQVARNKVNQALKDSMQWAGSRPAPLTQVDRFLNRIDLFVRLHRIGQYAADAAAGERQGDMPIVYWSDLLKFGGLGSAWNEKKGRRAYKLIYADLVTHQDHPMIRAYLEHERYKTMDDLETTFDALHGRSKPAETPTTVLENQLANAQASGSGSGGLPPPLGASEVPEEDALLNLAESGQAVPLTQAPSTSSSAASLPSSRKRKLANTEPEAIPELVPVPIERQTALPGRENDTEIRAGIVAELVRGGQWSGSRPAVINSLGSLIYRVLLLIQIHQNETIGANNEVVYWSDCVKHGGVSQAWNSRKASRQAFKKTYSDLVKYQHHPVIRQILSNASTTDIKTAETALTAISTGSAPTSIAPSSPRPASMHPSSPPASKRRRSTPEWSESPPNTPHHARQLTGSMDESFLSQATAPSHSGFNVASEQTTENTTAPMETEPGSEVDELDDGDL